MEHKVPILPNLNFCQCRNLYVLILTPISTGLKIVHLHLSTSPEVVMLCTCITASTFSFLVEMYNRITTLVQKRVDRIDVPVSSDIFPACPSDVFHIAV